MRGSFYDDAGVFITRVYSDSIYALVSPQHYKRLGIFRYVVIRNDYGIFVPPSSEWTHAYMQKNSDKFTIIGLNSKDEMIKGILNGSFKSQIKGHLEMLDV